MLFEEEDYYSSSRLTIMTMKQTKKINKRRFNHDQVKSLELIFENETKLEPKKKVQVAQELGLEPRQVAIWFQNKRARYKSRQLERDYTILRSNYNSLASQFDSLKKENQALLSQLQKLKELVDKDENNNSSNNNNNKEEESNNKLSEWEEDENKPTISASIEGSEYGTSSIISSDEGSCGGNVNAHYYMVDQIAGDQIDIEILGAIAESGWDDGLRPDVGLFDGDTCGQWWEFWS